jgi:hypothetical protein
MPDHGHDLSFGTFITPVSDAVALARQAASLDLQPGDLERGNAVIDEAAGRS